MASVISQLAPKVKVSREPEHHSASQSGMMFALNKLPKFVGEKKKTKTSADSVLSLQLSSKYFFFSIVKSKYHQIYTGTIFKSTAQRH